MNKKIRNFFSIQPKLWQILLICAAVLFTGFYFYDNGIRFGKVTLNDNGSTLQFRLNGREYFAMQYSPNPVLSGVRFSGETGIPLWTIDSSGIDLLQSNMKYKKQGLPVDSVTTFLKTNTEQIGLDGTFANKDTITLTAGTWLVICNLSYTFTDGANFGGFSVKDSILVRMWNGSKTLENSEQNVTYTYPDHARNEGMSGIISFSSLVKITSPVTYYLQAKEAVETSLIHFVNNEGISCILLQR
jgi:hypothetical protein